MSGERDGEVASLHQKKWKKKKESFWHFKKIYIVLDITQEICKISVGKPRAWDGVYLEENVWTKTLRRNNKQPHKPLSETEVETSCWVYWAKLFGVYFWVRWGANGCHTPQHCAEAAVLILTAPYWTQSKLPACFHYLWYLLNIHLNKHLISHNEDLFWIPCKPRARCASLCRCIYFSRWCRHTRKDPSYPFNAI